MKWFPQALRVELVSTVTLCICFLGRKSPPPSRACKDCDHSPPSFEVLLLGDRVSTWLPTSVPPSYHQQAEQNIQERGQRLALISVVTCLECRFSISIG